MKYLDERIICTVTFDSPITEKIHKEVLSLPISPAMNKEEAFYIAQILNEF